jgi:hypothetical protein
MDVHSTFWIQDITDWWQQQHRTHSKYFALSIVGRNIFSRIPHGVGVEISFSLRRDVIGWRQQKPKGETLREILLQGSLLEPIVGFWQALTPHWIELKQRKTRKSRWEAEERKLPRMAKVHEVLEM